MNTAKWTIRTPAHINQKAGRYQYSSSVLIIANISTPANPANPTHRKGMTMCVRMLRIKINEKIAREASASPK
jgi:hypothetical protein